jgi:hypothetical protein
MTKSTNKFSKLEPKRFTIVPKANKISSQLIQERNIASLARKAAKLAIKKASKKNVSVTIADAGKVYRLHPDGRRELIMSLPRKVKVKKSVIKIAD